MASPKLIPYSDPELLAADTAAVLQAAKDAGLTHDLTDAAGNPLTPSHPLLARNPGFTTTAYATVHTFDGVDGGLMALDDLVLATLPDIRTQGAVDAPTKPTSVADAPAYQAALRALVPDEGGFAIVQVQQDKAGKGG